MQKNGREKNVGNYHFESGIKLLEDVHNGDMDAFNYLYEKYHKQVYHIVLHMVGNEEDAEEVANDIFIKIFYNPNMYRKEVSIDAWLRRIAKNAAIDLIRYKNRRPTAIPMDKDGKHTDYAQVDPALELTSIDMVIFRDMIKSLTENEQTIYKDRFERCLTYKEIAEKYGCHINRVKARLHSLKIKLMKRAERNKIKCI